MLRPAPLPSPFYFPPATTSFASPPATSYPVSPQFQSEMEGVEAALKSSFRKEMALKSTQQAFLDNLCADNVQSWGPGDDFFVDELLDFSNEDEFVGGEGGRDEEEEEDEEVAEKASSGISVSPPQQTPEAEDDKNSDGSPSFSPKDDYLPVPTGELGVPADDVESLEWLSHFVEDSNSEYSIPFPADVLPEWPKRVYRSSPGNPVSPGPGLKTPVLAKTRSKRSRAGVRIWLHGSSPLAESSSSSSSSGAATANLHSASAEKPPAKKQKKKPAGEAHPTRRCSHCGVQKTPQWRTGPMGSKTLCNACGVRYKSGRLLPEYRPASSPTFSSELHSNHHRKVLEMRRKKEVVGPGEPGWGPPEVVASF